MKVTSRLIGLVNNQELRESFYSVAWASIRFLVLIFGMLNMLAGLMCGPLGKTMEWGTYHLIAGLVFAWLADRSRAWDEAAARRDKK